MLQELVENENIRIISAKTLIYTHVNKPRYNSCRHSGLGH